jgi:tripartite-type tricarboxylate transporter receptor subunit TctC
MAQDAASGVNPVLMSSIAAANAVVQAGKVRPLAVTSAMRFQGLPDLPALNETLPGVVVDGWFGVVAPAGTPREVVNRLNAEIGNALAAPDVKERALSAGAEPAPSSPEEFAAYIREETKKWGEVVRTAGIKLQ